MTSHFSHICICLSQGPTHGEEPPWSVLRWLFPVVGRICHFAGKFAIEWFPDEGKGKGKGKAVKTRHYTTSSSEDDEGDEGDEGDDQGTGELIEEDELIDEDGKIFEQEEVDELLNDLFANDPEPPLAPKPKKVTIRLPKNSKVRETKQESDEEEENKAETHKDKRNIDAGDVSAGIAFAVEKKGVVSRPVAFSIDIDFDSFRFRVANAFGEAAHEQELVWKTNRMLKNASWGALKEEADFEGMIEHAGGVLEVEATKFQMATAKNEADAANAKKKGKPFVPKPIPALSELVILIRDSHFEQKSKVKKKDKKSNKEEGAGDLRGVGGKILEYQEKLKARKCATCGKSCILIPIPGGPPEHKEMTNAQVLLWAQLAAKGNTSLASPPQQLVLQMSDQQPHRRGKAKPGPSTSASDQIGNEQSEPDEQQDTPSPKPDYVPPLVTAPQYPYANPQPGYYPPPPMPPPPPPYGYYHGYPGPYGYQPPPAPHFGAHPPPPITGQTLLSEWLPRCDQGERGRNHDNFTGLIAGFSAAKIYRLFDLQNKSRRYLMRDIKFPTTPGAPPFQMAEGTATRL
ncbi:hypothetical protein BDV93DRAFT_566269 [Ceratobasidium sp. AG-I]|nr:hypothetical protein BDV93DRAFT_566269 [Ceratobasidium sp. AG-I]